jgi:hypothetical protein
MQALLARGTFVNDCNNAGRTPLFVAVSLRFNEVVMLLLDNRANPHAEVHLSLSLAAEMKAEAIVKALEEHGVAFSPFRRPRADNRGGQRLLMSLSGGEAEQMGCTARLDFPQTAPASGPESRGYAPAGFQRGMYLICSRHPATQTLIPCNHKACCRGCIKQFVEEFAPCPIRGLKFYATKQRNKGFPMSPM